MYPGTVGETVAVLAGKGIVSLYKSVCNDLLHGREPKALKQLKARLRGTGNKIDFSECLKRFEQKPDTRSAAEKRIWKNLHATLDEPI